MRLVYWPADTAFTDVPQRLGGVLDDHPLVQHRGRTADLRPLRMSDVVPSRESRRSRTYAGVFAPFGAPYGLVIPVARGAEVTLVASRL